MILPHITERQIEVLWSLHTTRHVKPGTMTTTLNRMIEREWVWRAPGAGTHDVTLAVRGGILCANLFDLGDQKVLTYEETRDRVRRLWVDLQTRKRATEIARIIWPKHRLKTQAMKYLLTPIVNRLIAEGELRRHNGTAEPLYSKVPR